MLVIEMELDPKWDPYVGVEDSENEEQERKKKQDNHFGLCV